MREGNGLANAILIGYWIKIGFTAKGEFRKGCGYCAELDWMKALLPLLLFLVDRNRIQIIADTV